MVHDPPLKARIGDQRVHEHGKQDGDDERPQPLPVVTYRHRPPPLCSYRL